MYFALFTLLLIIADQVTKYFTVSMLKPVGSVEIIKNILSFTYVENRGAAFGILQNARWVFIVLTTIAVAAIIGLLLNVQTWAVNPYESIQTAIFDMFHEHEYQSYT